MVRAFEIAQKGMQSYWGFYTKASPVPEYMGKITLKGFAFKGGNV